MANEKESAGSDKAELKKFLRVARSEPVHMAFAAGASGKAILKLDKLKSPRALEKMLKEEAGTKGHRSGTVVIDAEDAKLARFTVNREISGFARKLAAALKGTGVSKVMIATEDGTTVEQAAEDEEEEARAPQGAAAPAAEAAAAAPADVRSAQPDPALQRKLAKASQVWDATVAKIGRDLDQLVAAATKASTGHALAHGLDREIRVTAVPLLKTLEANLSRVLDEAAAQTDASAQRKLLDDARKTAGQLANFAQTSPIVAHLDDNPFTPLAVGKTLTASLSALAAVIR